MLDRKHAGPTGREHRGHACPLSLCELGCLEQEVVIRVALLAAGDLPWTHGSPQG